MPHDVQTEALDFPSELFEKRIWYVPRNVPDSYLIEKAVEMIKNSKNPMLVAGGGVIYSDSADKAARFIMNCNQKGIPLLFLQDVNGFMVGSRAEKNGIIKDGAKMVNAMSNSRS